MSTHILVGRSGLLALLGKRDNKLAFQPCAIDLGTTRQGVYKYGSAGTVFNTEARFVCAPRSERGIGYPIFFRRLNHLLIIPRMRLKSHRMVILRHVDGARQQQRTASS